MSFLPICLQLSGRSVLVVGGGRVAAQKVRILSGYGADVTVAAPRVSEQVRANGVKVLERPYAPDLLEGRGLVYACTDDRAVNRRIGEDARARGILVNVADDPEVCDFTSPAIHQSGDMSVAVSSDAKNVKRAVAWRNVIRRLEENGGLPASSPEDVPAVVPAAKKGRVALVGFGPGDPELLTFRADSELREADVIFYDDLIDPKVLARYPGRAEYVGKRKGSHSHAQEEISALLGRAALAGQRVVRLKGGDPGIFGRGGEEADYLRKLGVEVTIVPGVTSACAAAASAGIPLTKRGIAREVTLRTAHGDPASAGRGTMVYYMAASSLKRVARELGAEGWSASTPILLASHLGAPGEELVRTTLGELDSVTRKSPLLLIAGDVVKLDPVDGAGL